MSEKPNDYIREFQTFIGFDTNVLKYLHNTYSEEVAQAIVMNGFRYEKYLENTTDFISGVDVVVLKYFMNIRSSYGEHTAVIQIGKNLGDKYSTLLKGTPYHFCEVLAMKPPVYNNDSDEPIYTLAPQFIKGYFDHRRGISIHNALFAPYNDHPIFEINTKKLLEKQDYK